MPHYGYGSVGFGQAETVQTLAAGSVILVPTGGMVSPIGWSGTPYTVDNPLKAVLTAEETVTSTAGRSVLLTSGATVQNPRPVVVLDTGIGASVSLDAGTRIRVLTDDVDVVSAASGSTWTEAPAEPVEEGCPDGWTMIKGRCVETIIVPPPAECPEGWFRNSVGECEAGEVEAEPPPVEVETKPWYKTKVFYITTAVGGTLALGTVLWAALRRKG
jgi:hypothetical protein